MSNGVLLALGTGGALALASSVHCVVMCGPVSIASRARAGVYAGLLYLVGRVVSYSVLGALAGGVGHVLLASRWARWAEAGLSWLLALLLLHAALRHFRIAVPARLVRLR